MLRTLFAVNRSGSTGNVAEVAICENNDVMSDARFGDFVWNNWGED